MSAQKLIVFKHASELGNAPANKLFDLVKVKKNCAGAPRSFSDYDVTKIEELRAIIEEHFPNVEVKELI